MVSATPETNGSPVKVRAGPCRAVVSDGGGNAALLEATECRFCHCGGSGAVYGSGRRGVVARCAGGEQLGQGPLDGGRVHGLREVRIEARGACGLLVLVLAPAG